MAIYKDFVDKEDEFLIVEDIPQSYDPTPPSYPPKVEPLISLHALTRFYTPQTIKVIRYIKHRKYVILFDSGNTHNFIHGHIF
jgi:hypothetical protein